MSGDTHTDSWWATPVTVTMTRGQWQGLMAELDVAMSTRLERVGGARRIIDQRMHERSRARPAPAATKDQA